MEENRNIEDVFIKPDISNEYSFETMVYSTENHKSISGYKKSLLILSLSSVFLAPSINSNADTIFEESPVFKDLIEYQLPDYDVDSEDIYINEDIFINPNDILSNIKVSDEIKNEKRRKEIIKNISNKFLKRNLSIEDILHSERHKH